MNTKHNFVPKQNFMQNEKLMLLSQQIKELQSGNGTEMLNKHYEINLCISDHTSLGRLLMKVP